MLYEDGGFIVVVGGCLRHREFADEFRFGHSGHLWDAVAGNRGGVVPGCCAAVVEDGVAAGIVRARGLVCEELRRVEGAYGIAIGRSPDGHGGEPFVVDTP